MEQKQLEQFKVWFDDYVAGFYSDDEFLNANIKLKEDHSRRVCGETTYLAECLSLSANQSCIANVTALLHDIGRFEQFAEYRTYNDTRSVNHSLLGLEVLRRFRVLDGVNVRERPLIEKAIEYHGMKELPKDLDGQELLFSRLIRDADKLDVFRVVIDCCTLHRDAPEAFNLEVELPDEPWYSADVAEALLAGQRVDYSSLRTWNDMKLLQLGWVYDVNFPATLKRIKQHRFLEGILEFLPRTADIRNIADKIFQYIDSRIE